MLENKLKEVYQERFKGKKEIKERDIIWQVLCRHFIQKFIPNRKGTIIDLGAGYCEFINNIDCRKRYAYDLNEDVKKYAGGGIKVINDHWQQLTKHFRANSVDYVFMSNFLEHLKSREDVIAIFNSIRKILKKGGRVLILQPNIRFLYDAYWDFFDHNIPLSDKSVAEALTFSGFRVIKNYPKFIPYTTKSRYPKNRFIVWLYLHLPFAFSIFGKQAFLVAEKA